MTSKLVEDAHYHLWTDALHARALAHEARNKWDRGTYVRWAIITSWTVLEVACQEALDDPTISYRFKPNLNEAIRLKGLPVLSWGAGIWQAVSGLQEARKGLVHKFTSQADLFPGPEMADFAIEVAREAVLSIFQHVGRPAPAWICDNEDRGWEGRPSFAVPMMQHGGADPEDPEAVRVAIVLYGKEFLTDVLPPDGDPEPYIHNLLNSANLRLPFSEVRVYKGAQLLKTVPTHMRGAD